MYVTSWSNNIPSLYKLSLLAINWKNTNIDELKELPGVVKEDLLRHALVRGKLKKHLGHFLHRDIKRLDISECEVTDSELQQLSGCVDLRALEMNPPRYQRNRHSSSVLESIFSRFRRLTILHIQQNDGVNDRVVSVVAESCPLLRELDLGGCSELSDEAVRSVANLRYLHVLNLSDTRVSDRGLASLAKGDSRFSLCELKLNNCVRVSDDGIKALVKGCGRLSILVFCGCPKVSVDCQLALDSLMNRDKDKRTRIITWTVYFED